MALEALARWFGRSRGDDAAKCVAPVLRQCDECGRFSDTKYLKRARCSKCDADIHVCEDHRVSATCLKCGYAVRCDVCGVLVKERCTNTVVCTKCEEVIGVCDKDVAGPVCKECVST